MGSSCSPGLGPHSLIIMDSVSHGDVSVDESMLSFPDPANCVDHHSSHIRLPRDSILVQSLDPEKLNLISAQIASFLEICLVS